MNIPERTFSWSRLELFRFSAATGNAHRIHYDVDYARSEGLESVVVHTTLHALMLWQTLTAEVDERSVRGFEWRNHAPLYDDQAVVVQAVVERDGNGWRVALSERRIGDARVVCSGHALVEAWSGVVAEAGDDEVVAGHLARSPW